MKKREIKKKTDEFLKIWQEITEPLIEEIVKENNLHSKNKRVVKFIAYKSYCKQRNIFLQSFMAHKTNNIDRHKIASCMTKAIIGVKPIQIPLRDKLKAFFSGKKIDCKIIMVNEYLALSVAISILRSYIFADAEKELKHDIHFPAPFPKEDDSYVKDVCLDLYYTGARKFNIISYANIFFLLEKYSCRWIQCCNLENKLISMLELEKNSNAEIENEIKEIKFKSEECNN